MPLLSSVASAGGDMGTKVFNSIASMWAQKKQNEYNSPRAQMGRFKDAGLNPNLIYGQGNPGNQSAPVQMSADNKSMEIMGLLNNTRMVNAQVQAQEASTIQKLSSASLAQMQERVASANPYLDSDYLGALVSGLQSTAEQKAADASVAKAKADWFTGTKSWNVNGLEMHGPAGAVQMETELNLLLRKYDLSTQDQQIKAEILKSKEFQNDILEVQKKFMTNGEITPQHVLQFINLLLMKLL